MTQSINYSSEKLASEFSDRSHIRFALEGVKSRYKLKNKRVIELGCGLGDNLKIFSSDNNTLGFEGLEGAVSIANQQGVRVLQVDLEGDPIPLEAESSDVVLCMDILEHLNHPEFSIKESWRILRENGLLVVNVPNHFTLSGRLRILLGSGVDSQGYFPDSNDWENPHVRFFRHGSISALLEKNGFEIVEDCSSQAPAFPGLNWLSSIRKTNIPSYIAHRFPDLFAAGFFLIAKKIKFDSKS
ncbi:MAG: class I SAM-dependent methyltransferase [Woeseiaceae bacterium]